MVSELPTGWPKDVKKAREVVNAKSIGSEFSVLDRKLFNILLGHAYRHLQTRPTHRIALSQLNGLFFDHGRSGRIRDSLERLWKHKIAIDYMDEEDNPHELRCHYLSFDLCHYEDGHIVYAFDPLLLRFLRNPKVYSQIQLNTVLKFSSGPALVLYEQMRMCYSRYHPVFSLTLEEAHAFFEVKGVYLKRFDSFRQRIIEPAVIQVNEVAEFDVGVEYQSAGQGSRIVGMTFTAQPKSPKRMISAADAVAPSRRRKDANTLDMFDGCSQNEMIAKPVLRADTMEQARRIAGRDADIEAMLETWAAEFGGSGVLNLSANEAFLSWLSLKAARDASADLAGIDVDAFYETMMGGE